MKKNDEKNQEIRSPLNIEIRYTEQGDGEHLKRWLMDPDVNRWFPMNDEVEIDDAVMRWVGFYRYRCSLTALIDGKPVGMTTLYLQPYKKLCHQCEFGIIVSPEMRVNLIGSELLNNAIRLAKDKFHIELLHLQVYKDNPAIRLYKRLGFTEFGRQEEWIKENDGSYTGRVFMQRKL